MKLNERPLKTFRLHNFKAVRDSGIVHFTPLTVFIGNNGSGKSSLIEGLEAFQTLVNDGLDEAMNRWRGFEFIWNDIGAKLIKQAEDNGTRRRLPKNRLYRHNSIEFELTTQKFRALSRLASLPGANEVHIVREHYFAMKGGFIIKQKKVQSVDVEFERKSDGTVNQRQPAKDSPIGPRKLRLDESLFSQVGEQSIHKWQFLSMNANAMGEPYPTKRTGDGVRLRKDGSNVADYLNEIYEIDSSIYNGIIETMRYVLPYATDVQPQLTSELGRQRYLLLSEQQTDIPAWLFSTGTLRIIALLAVLRHPKPPPLLFIEEIENGLDPRTLNLLVEEIRYAVESGRTQVVVTTHSPYLLDLVMLSQIIVVERDETGQPIFFRPDEKELREWSKSFAPGQLYTMSQLQRPAKGKSK